MAGVRCRFFYPVAQVASLAKSDVCETSYKQWSPTIPRQSFLPAVWQKLHLSEFEIEQDEEGRPTKMTCPHGQSVAVKQARTSGWQGRFNPEICADCPFRKEGRCRAKPQKRDRRYMLSFTLKELRAAKRRRNYMLYKKEEGNLRAASEATMRSAKLPFPAGQLPVRGKFRVTSMMIASVLHLNMRRIWRYETETSLSDFIFRIFPIFRQKIFFFTPDYSFSSA